MKVKVMVVDDSAFMRRVITDLLESDPEIEVVGTASNGLDALDKIPKLQPDVVTLDVEMPKLDGLKALDDIICKHGLPVIMLSSTTQEGAENTLIALEKGAFDFVAKPSGSISLDLHKVKDEILEKIHLAAKNKRNSKSKVTERRFEVRKTIVPRSTETKSNETQSITVRQEAENIGTSHSLKHVVLVGTSTGWTKSITTIVFPFALG